MPARGCKTWKLFCRGTNRCGARCSFAFARSGQWLSIGVNDLHIAAHARSEGLVLVTNNTSEFDRVPALELENWVGNGP
jgi:predicted nucleic acid-binding protein